MKHHTLLVHICCCKWQSFILFMTNIPLYIYIWHIFIHLSVDGHLDYFPILANDKTLSTGEGNGKPLQYYCLENPMNMPFYKGKKIWRWKKNFPGWQAPNMLLEKGSVKNEEAEPKQQQHPAVDMINDRSKVWCCKEQYCIGTWNVRSMS